MPVSGWWRKRRRIEAVDVMEVLDWEVGESEF